MRYSLKVLIRNTLKNKSFSILNILGLSIGMASALLILLWVQGEYSTEKFHKNLERLFVVYNRDHEGANTWVNNNTAQILAEKIKSEYPEVEAITRYNSSNFLLNADLKKIKSTGAIVDSSFLKIFNFPLLEGEQTSALTDPHGIVLTSETAKALFGSENAIGKTLRIDSAHLFTVTGILKDLPSNTTFSFNYLLPHSFLKELGWYSDSWGNFSTSTYLLLKDGTRSSAFENKIKNIAKIHTRNEAIPIVAEPFLHPIEKIHLYNKDVNGQLVKGNIEKVRLFSIIAICILIIACINFMNLSTAKSETRAKEIGIRKVVGITRNRLIFQFICESIFLTLVSFIISIGIILLILPQYNEFSQQTLTIPFSNPYFWLVSLLFVLLTGLLAGSYPAFYLSAFKPINALKSLGISSTRSINLRKTLVVFQFTLSSILIVSTIIIYNQINYGLGRENGYDSEKLIYIPIEGKLRSNYNVIRDQILATGAVSTMNKSIGPITQRRSDRWGFQWEGSSAAQEQLTFIKMGTDVDFIKTMGVKLLRGRDIDITRFKTDSNAVLLNHAAISVMNLKDPIDKLIRSKSDPDDYFQIVGIIEDFILESPFTTAIQPLMIVGPGKYYPGTAHLKLSAQFDTKTSLDKIRETLKKANPDYPFDYTFVDESYAIKFMEANQTAKLISLFAGLTILIASIGLFGLTAYVIESRTKEIGIRKVLGASVLGVMGLLSKDFLILIFISIIVSIPISWLIMNSWLDNYTYRIQLGPWFFLLAGSLTIVITLLTISWHAYRAANANPIKSIGAE